MMLYSGKVTNKQTGTPMAGVVVTDGRNVVLTAADGSYSLPGWERTRTVAVCTLTKEDRDWFYFTDGKGGTYDFAISPADAVETFEILHVSDSEISGDRDVEWVAFMQEHCKKKMPAFVIHTGDITRRDGILLHQEHMNYNTMGCPVRYVIGNHDYAAGTDTTVYYGEQPYEEEAGPVWNSFDCGGVHCVVLSISKGCKSDMASGYDREDQWIWLKNDLEIAGKGKPVIIFEHSEGESLVDGIDLKQMGVVAWIYGHRHTNIHHVEDGIHWICTGRAHTGGIDASPAGIRRITYKNGELVSQMHYRYFPVAEADKAVWQTKLPGRVLFCEQAMEDKKLYVGTMCDEYPGESGVACLDADTGAVIWFVPMKGNGVKNNFSLDNGRLYVQDSMGNLYCLNAADGAVIWQQKTIDGGRTTFPAFVAEDVVIAGKMVKTRAYDKQTGQLRWEAPTQRKGGSNYANSVYDSKRGYVLVNGQWGNLMCLNLKTGEVVWQRTEKPLWYRNSTPVVDGDVVYAGGFDQLLKLDAATGEVLLQADVGEPARALGAPDVESDGNMNVAGAPVIEGDVIYCPTASSGVLAVDKNTLQVLRRFPAGPASILTAPYVKQGAEMVESSPVIVGDTLIFTAMDGKVYFYNKNTGELLRTVCMGAASLVSPIVTEDAIYTADFDGNICRF